MSPDTKQCAGCVRDDGNCSWGETGRCDDGDQFEQIATQQTGILQAISGNTLKFLVVTQNRKCPVSIRATPNVITKAVTMVGEYTRFTVEKAEVIDVELVNDVVKRERIMKDITIQKPKLIPGRPSLLDECEKKECPNGGMRCYEDNGRTEVCRECLCPKCAHAKCPIAVEGNP